MSLLFGPVKSRRLGLSLGVELVPSKICSMDCLYCEVGKTTTLTTLRASYLPWEEIEKALYEAKEREEEYEVLTFTGSGEPTLNIHFERAVEFARNLIKKPISVLTNSSTLNIETVRRALSEVDYVLASLDAAREKSFKLVNRPAEGVSLREIIMGLKNLREEMKGELWLEILLVKGVNDSEEDLKVLREVIEYINPHKVQLNTVVRPPAYAVAKPLSFEELEKVRAYLGERAEIITPKDKKIEGISFKRNLEELLFDYLSRRPAPLTELTEVFKDSEELKRVLQNLIKEGKIKRLLYQGEVYFSA
ncbi:MAG: radical SAM protein [Caldimicrobium sp.]|jgi:wyosine [tRNA(Phe)-imidazoG37] synthetase (radical SAM superfamily)|uniref:Radical SAM protein n=1 Tax=Caldimicrobium thiodismutans TaxID=1653476 RepID=A0A2N7PIW9_9BACT|nr:MAG: radical SAM protein [Caldimicrobium thiodismutans]